MSALLWIAVAVGLLGLIALIVLIALFAWVCGRGADARERRV